LYLSSQPFATNWKAGIGFFAQVGRSKVSLHRLCGQVDAADAHGASARGSDISTPTASGFYPAH
jgi:uncharacterized protein (DUF2237 family)